MVKRGALILIGVGFVALALLGQRVGFGGIDRGSLAQMSTLLLGIVLLLLGVMDEAAFRRRARAVGGGIAQILMIIVVTFMGMEIIAVLVLNVLSDRADQAHAAATAPYFERVEWGGRYLSEYDELVTRYEPFVLWHAGEHTGATININADGIRYTPNSACTEDAYTIYMFGGSTMWGVGVPDWGTIPAHLADMLNTGESICVVNMGEQAYTTTQELIRFVQQLQRGARPDLVVFYDGINDVYSAYQSGLAGGHQNLSDLRKRFEGDRPDPLVELLSKTYAYQLIRALVTRGQTAYLTYESNGVDPDTLAGDVVSVYAENVRMIRSLADLYEFEVLLFWQPTLLTSGKPLSPEEQVIFESRDPMEIRLFQAVYDRVQRGEYAPEDVISLSSLFDNTGDYIWWDSQHLTFAGNRSVAEAILPYVEAVIDDHA